MINQPLFQAGDFFINEIAKVTIYMEDQAGVEAVGFSYTDMLVQYGNSESDGLVDVILTADNFLEVGRGLYLVDIPASGMTPEGPFVYVADAAATGYTTFRGAGKITTDFFEVSVEQSYDYSTKTLTSLCWLSRNGQAVTDPIDCSVTLREAGGTEVSEILSSSPNSEGVFTCVDTPLDLETLTSYEVIGVVSYNGTSYTTVIGMSVLN